MLRKIIKKKNKTENMNGDPILQCVLCVPILEHSSPEHHTHRLLGASSKYQQVSQASTQNSRSP